MKRLRTPFITVLLVSLVLTALVGRAPSRVTTHAAKAKKKRGSTIVRDRAAGRYTFQSFSPPEQKDTTIEPSIAVNPANPKNAVTCFQVGRVDGGGDQDNGCATTFDGGKTWKVQNLPGLTPDSGSGEFDRASDAVVAFGPHNVVYANDLVFDDTSDNGLRSAIVTNVSKDGGKTWGPPVTTIDDQGGGLNDKNWIIVDNSKASGHHYGRVYVVWDRVAPVLESHSDDEGQTWSPPSVIYPGQGIGAMPVIQPNGDLTVIFDSISQQAPPVTNPEAEGQDLGFDRLSAATAVGAGTVPGQSPLAWSPPVTIESYQGNEVRLQRAGTLPTAAIDDKTGRIYVSWEDGRWRKKGANAAPENDIAISWSDDGGISWTAAKKVNPGKGGGRKDHYNPMLAVGPDGSVRIGYLVRREGASESDFSPYVRTYFQQSMNHGKTWSKPLILNRQRSDVRFAAFSRGGAFFGDYNQMAAAGSWTYITRCIAYSPFPGAPAEFPPKVHHQQTWVAVIDSDGNGKP